MDRISKKHRSWNMSRIRSKNTSPELAVRRALHSLGYRFRLHSGKLPGKPDIVLTKYSAVIFVHGCFWHRHKRCKQAYTPKSRLSFWLRKFTDNVERDKRQRRALKANGWRSIVIWECQTGDSDRLRSKLSSLLTKGPA